MIRQKTISLLKNSCLLVGIVYTSYLFSSGLLASEDASAVSFVGVSVKPHVNDLYPPYDLEIIVSFENLTAKSIRWEATSINFIGTDIKPVGGAVICSHNPAGRFPIPPFSRGHQFRFKSSNNHLEATGSLDSRSIISAMKEQRLRFQQLKHQHWSRPRCPQR